MTPDKIDHIAKVLSNVMVSEYYDALRKRLYERDELEYELGLISEEESKKRKEPTLEDKINAISDELRLHSERYTVELIKTLFIPGYDQQEYSV